MELTLDWEMERERESSIWWKFINKEKKSRIGFVLLCVSKSACLWKCLWEGLRGYRGGRRWSQRRRSKPKKTSKPMQMNAMLFNFLFLCFLFSINKLVWGLAEAEAVVEFSLCIFQDFGHVSVVIWEPLFKVGGRTFEIEISCAWISYSLYFMPNLFFYFSVWTVDHV